MKTWKIGCMPQMVSGRQRYEWVPALARILKGLNNFSEFMGRMGDMEELSFNEVLLTNDEIGGQHTFRVCQALVTALSFGNGSFEFLVKFV